MVSTESLHPNWKHQLKKKNGSGRGKKGPVYSPWCVLPRGYFLCKLQSLRDTRPGQLQKGVLWGILPSVDPLPHE